MQLNMTHETKNKVTEKVKQFHNEKLYNLYFPSDIIRVVL
jgi:hypothetical protein